jgi:hypothetical protein
VIARLGQRAIELCVALFAALGFAFVPLGERSGLEHLRAIVTTEATREAMRELVIAADRLRSHLTGELAPEAPPAPSQSRAIPTDPVDAGAPDASLSWRPRG